MDKLLSLGIDPWSMLVYLVNTGVLLVILTYFLYKPILKFIDQRRQQIIDNIEEAKNLQKGFEEKLAQGEAKRKETEETLKEEIDKLKKYTEEKKKKLLTEMEQARSDIMQKAREEIDAKKASLIKDAQNEVVKLMTKIILEIVENKVPENVIQESIESSWKEHSKK